MVLVLVAGSLLVAVPAPAATGVSLVSDPAALVNPMIGTKEGGNTFPGPSVPFGMLQWGPDSSPRAAGGGYAYESTAISGFGLNRMSGAGCPAFGDVPILPVSGTPPADRRHRLNLVGHWPGLPAASGCDSAVKGDDLVCTGDGGRAVGDDQKRRVWVAVGEQPVP